MQYSSAAEAAQQPCANPVQVTHRRGLLHLLFTTVLATSSLPFKAAAEVCGAGQTPDRQWRIHKQTCLHLHGLHMQ